MRGDRTWGWVIISAVATGTVACSQAVQLVHETQEGGTVTYLYREDRGGAMFSPHRGAALELIQARCPNGFRILREGESRAESAVTGNYEGDDTHSRRWGLKFQCRP